MKYTYYGIINGKEELIRTSKTHDDYKYALVYADKYIFKCSSKKEYCQRELDYRTAGWIAMQNGSKREYSSLQMYNPERLKIIEIYIK